MKILLVGAGASFSTKDVEQGYFQALQKVDGVETHLYLLDKRIEVAAAWTKFVWRKFRRADPNFKPTWSDAIYRAGIEALEMALRYEVDWVVVVSAMYFHPDVIVMMRRAGLKICVLFTESPYEDEKQARVAGLVQLCSTNERTSLAVLGPHCFYLAHAFSPNNRPPGYPPVQGEIVQKNELSENRIRRQQGELPSHDVVFVGTGFQERIDLLKSVDWSGIDLGLYGTWSLLAPSDKLRKFICGGIMPNFQTQELYGKAKIGLNLHRTSMVYSKDAPRISHAESLNPRAFELAENGTFCITDYRKEGDEIFGPSQPTFKGADDLACDVRWFLAHPEACQTLAKETQEKVQGHTYDTRVQTLLERLGG